MSDDDLKRLMDELGKEIQEGARPFRDLLERVHRSEVRPLLIPPDVREEIRWGAEPFRRALSLARYIGHHSLKGRDMR